MWQRFERLLQQVLQHPLAAEMTQFWHRPTLERHALGQLAALLRQTTRDRPARKPALLSDGERRVLNALLAQYCQPDHDDLPAPETLPLVAAVEHHMRHLPVVAQQQFRDLLLVFEYATPLFAPQHRTLRFSSLPSDAQMRLLDDWATSRLVPRRATFHGLKTLCMLAYWSNSATWAAIGYDGPLLDQPGGQRDPTP